MSVSYYSITRFANLELHISKDLVDIKTNCVLALLVLVSVCMALRDNGLVR